MGSDSPQPFAIVTPAPETRELLAQPDGKSEVEEEIRRMMLHVNVSMWGQKEGDYTNVMPAYYFKRAKPAR